MHTFNMVREYPEYLIVAPYYSCIIMYSFAVALRDQQREGNISGYERRLLLYPGMIYGKLRSETYNVLKI
jgi:hypothetical protein